MRNNLWKVFENTGNIQAYLYLKKCEELLSIKKNKSNDGLYIGDLSEDKQRNLG